MKIALTRGIGDDYVRDMGDASAVIQNGISIPVMPEEELVGVTSEVWRRLDTGDSHRTLSALLLLAFADPRSRERTFDELRKGRDLIFRLADDEIEVGYGQVFDMPSQVAH